MNFAGRRNASRPRAFRPLLAHLSNASSLYIDSVVCPRADGAVFPIYIDIGRFPRPPIHMDRRSRQQGAAPLARRAGTFTIRLRRTALT